MPQAETIRSRTPIRSRPVAVQPVVPEPQRPGPVSRFASAFHKFGPTGLPEAGIEMAQAASEGLQSDIGRISPGAGLVEKFIIDPALSLFEKGREAYGQGRYSETAGYGASAAVPIVGPLMAEFGEMLGEDDVAGALGAAGGMVASGKILPRVATGAKTAVPKAATTLGKTFLPAKYLKPKDALTRAIRPYNKQFRWDVDIDRAMPDLKAAEARSGVPVVRDPTRPASTIDRTIDLTVDAKRHIWDEVERRMQPLGQSVVISKNAIADAIENSISAHTRRTNPALADKIRAKAEVYRQGADITLAEAEDFLHSVNQRDAAYFAKNKTDMRKAAGDPEIAAELAEGDALRFQINSAVDRLTGPGIKELKAKHGALQMLEKELYRTRNVVARQLPESLSEQMANWYGAASVMRGVLAGDIGGAMREIFSGLAARGAAKYVRNINSADALIEQAFRDIPTPTAPLYPPIVTRPIAGALGPGATQLGPASSGPYVPPPPPPIAAGTRASRLGLLLNPGKTELPPAALPEGPIGPRAASIVVRDPATGRMKRVFTSEARQ